MLRHFGYGESAVHRDQLMDLYTRFQVAKYTNQRALDKIKAGQLPGPEMSIAKMALTDNLTRTAEFVAAVLGNRLVVDTGEWGTYDWSQFVCIEGANVFENAVPLAPGESHTLTYRLDLEAL